MILMKEYVSLATAAMKMDKNLFTKIIATVAKRGNFILNRHPYLKDFFEIFISGNYHRERKILKILACNSDFMASSKNETFMLIGAGRTRYYIFLDNFCLK